MTKYSVRWYLRLKLNDLLMYVLLGTTQFSCSRNYIDAFRGSTTPPLKSEDIVVVDLATIRDAVSSLVAETRDPDRRDLAAAYDSLLRKIQDSFGAFERRPFAEWGRNDWFGFYDRLRKRLRIDCSMGFVNNPAGGFVGCWWSVTEPNVDDDCEVYLQLEHEKLCFKITVCDQHTDTATQLRDRFSEIVLTAGTASGLHIRRPNRFGRGKWMTVAVLDGDYRAPSGVSNIHWGHLQGITEAAEKVLKNAAQQLPIV